MNAKFALSTVFGYNGMMRFLNCCFWLFLSVPIMAQQTEGTGIKLSEAQQRLKKLSGDEYDLDGIKINAGSREVRIPTRVELRQAPIEYLLVHETGKTHETVLTTSVNPSSVQVALLLANFQPATLGLLSRVPAEELPKIWKEEAPANKGGNLVQIFVEWESMEGRHSMPISQWVQNSETRLPPPDLDHWIFNGSYVDERGFIAQHEGSIIAVWLDRGAILNSPAEGNWDDQRWISLPKNIPDEGTEVTLLIRPVPVVKSSPEEKKAGITPPAP